MGLCFKKKKSIFGGCNNFRSNWLMDKLVRIIFTFFNLYSRSICTILCVYKHLIRCSTDLKAKVDALTITRGFWCFQGGKNWCDVYAIFYREITKPFRSSIKGFFAYSYGISLFSAYTSYKFLCPSVKRHQNAIRPICCQTFFPSTYALFSIGVVLLLQ